ncbi:MAG: DedA family protein [Puniceicoccales bacterium]|jgi:membrane protein DedA with SNARE-associated domain|nr:DedA family protein [Puniceicoccales bacterium]
MPSAPTRQPLSERAPFRKKWLFLGIAVIAGLLALWHFEGERLLSMDPKEFLQRYGYAALLIGTFLEGETIVIIAGLLAQQGYLTPWLIAVCAFTGSCTSDQLMFALGHWKGMSIIQRFPRLEKNLTPAKRLLTRYETVLILGFRFVYGVRNVTPILMGVSGVNYAKFVLLNIIGAVVWAISFTAAGYFCGKIITDLGESYPQLKYLVPGIVVALLLGVWGYHRFLRKAPARTETGNKTPPPEPIEPPHC